MQLYGHGGHDAGDVRGAGPYTAGQRAFAGHQRGSCGSGQKSGRTGCGAGKARLDGPRYRDAGAISGSTNAILHLPAIAHEFGIEIDADTFERIHKSAHYLLDVRPAGRWPSEYVYYAGGVPAIMEEVRHLLHLDVMTVTGKTLGENLDGLKVRGIS